MGERTKREPSPRASGGVGYPAAGCVDPSRRRFLGQLGRGAGGLGVLTAVGLPRLSHGQSAEVDFSVLEAHPARAAVAVPMDAAPAAPAAPPMAMAPPAPSPAPPAPAQASAPVELVAEHRALWVEPGYLILLRWERPVDDATAVAALEASTEAMSSYLTANVTEMNDLHDIDRLHTHEHALADLLEVRIAPATLEVLHLDHDCNNVCNRLGWSGPDPDHIPLPGVPPAPEYP